MPITHSMWYKLVVLKVWDLCHAMNHHTKMSVWAFTF